MIDLEEEICKLIRQYDYEIWMTALCFKIWIEVRDNEILIEDLKNLLEIVNEQKRKSFFALAKKDVT